MSTKYAIYNEIEPYAAEWMRNLVKAGHINDGIVEERSICDLTADDVRNATQAHFFAGLGGWSHALRLAGWPDDIPVWTGSCPCQPFSSAGKGKGFDDQRHLWPEFFRLIKECRPPIIFGEQVASPDGLKWLDVVSADLEGAGYAFGAADLCAAGVGAPHLRQRLYFVAYASGELLDGIRLRLQSGQSRQEGVEVAGRGQVGDLGDTSGRRETTAQQQGRLSSLIGSGKTSSLVISDKRRCGQEGQPRVGREMDARDDPRMPTKAEDTGLYDNMANTESDRRIQGIQNFAGSGERVVEKREPRRVAECGDTGNAVADSESIGRKQQQQRRDESEAFHARESYGTRSGEGGFWSNCDWLPCRDGKSRAVEPSTFPLANGVSARVGRLRAYGNAIVPQVAATFIRAVIEGLT